MPLNRSIRAFAKRIQSSPGTACSVHVTRRKEIASWLPIWKKVSEIGAAAPVRLLSSDLRSVRPTLYLLLPRSSSSVDRRVNVANLNPARCCAQEVAIVQRRAGRRFWQFYRVDAVDYIARPLASRSHAGMQGPGARPG
jgi:hypothetical protein